MSEVFREPIHARPGDIPKHGIVVRASLPARAGWKPAPQSARSPAKEGGGTPPLQATRFARAVAAGEEVIDDFAGWVLVCVIGAKSMAGRISTRAEFNTPKHPPFPFHRGWWVPLRIPLTLST